MSRRAELSRVGCECTHPHTCVGGCGDGWPVTAAAPLGSSGSAGGRLLQRSAKHPLPPGCPIPGPCQCPVALHYESSDFRHLQHLSFAGRGEQCSLKRKETCPRLHSRSALELGLRFSPQTPIPGHLLMPTVSQLKFQH